MRLGYKVLFLFFIFFFRTDLIYSQTPKDLLNIYRIVKVGEWLNKLTIKNEKVKVYYIQVEVTAANFEQARESGFTLAIQEALGTFITAERVIKFDEVIRNEIITYSGGYIQDFKIIKETRDILTTTLVMDVWVSESRIAHRLLNTSSNKGELDGRKIEAQLSTIVKDKADAFKLLDIVLQDFPSRAFELDIKNTNFQTLRKGTLIVEIPLEIRWSQKYLDSLKEALILLRDGNELRFQSNLFFHKDNMEEVTISIGSKIFYGLTFSGVDASFKDDEIIDLFYLHFKNASTIKISLSDEFESEIFTNCFYLQNTGNLFKKKKYDKQNIHEILPLNEFYEFNTLRAHFEINDKYDQKKNYLFELNNNNNSIKTSEIKKVKASIVKDYECKKNN